jgi:hypothetical protein
VQCQDSGECNEQGVGEEVPAFDIRMMRVEIRVRLSGVFRFVGGMGYCAVKA